MLTYKYYKFPSKDLIPKLWPDGVSISIIGQMKSKNDLYDELGNKIYSGPENSYWHVNVCYEGHADLSFVQQYEIQVNTPDRIWFGQNINNT